MEVRCLELENDGCMSLGEDETFQQSGIQSQGYKEAHFDRDTQTDALLEEQVEVMALRGNRIINCQLKSWRFAFL